MDKWTMAGTKERERREERKGERENMWMDG